jgi:OOP family OmpA-OmpF porin
MKSKKLLFFVFLIIANSLLFVQASSVKTQADIVEKWDDFSQEKINRTPQKLSNIVVFRSEGLGGTAINIYIDGEYQTSLLPGAYTQTTVCPGKHHIKPAYTNIQTRYREKQMKGRNVMLRSGKVYYFQVIDSGKKKLQVKALSQAESKSLFKKYIPKQNHTISRLNKRECPKMKNENFMK